MNLCGLLQSEKVTNGQYCNSFFGLHFKTLMILYMANSRGLQKPKGMAQNDTSVFSLEDVTDEKDQRLLKESKQRYTFS